MKGIIRIILGILGIAVIAITLHFASTIALRGPNLVDVGLGLLLGTTLIVVASGILSRYLVILAIIVGFPAFGWIIGSQVFGKGFGTIIGLIGGGFLSYQSFKKRWIQKFLTPSKKLTKPNKK